MFLSEKNELKKRIKDGDIDSLLTYLKGRVDESMEDLVTSINDTRYYQSQILAFREIIALYDK